MNFKRSLRSFFWKKGLDIRPFDGVNSEFPQTMKLLTVHGINLIVDIGAHVGAWGQRLYQMGYKGRMISYEPLSSAFDELKKVSKRYTDWTVPERCAVGSAPGTAKINIAQNGESSSLLPMNESHLALAPDSNYIAAEEVPVITLDDKLLPELTQTTHVFLKIDAQGFEHQVLEGARKCLPLIDGLQLELSTLKLYEGQELALSLMQFMQENGFSLHAVWPVVVDGNTGRTAQFDAIFFRDQSSLSEVTGNA